MLVYPSTVFHQFSDWCSPAGLMPRPSIHAIFLSIIPTFCHGQWRDGCRYRGRFRPSFVPRQNLRLAPTAISESGSGSRVHRGAAPEQSKPQCFGWTLQGSYRGFKSLTVVRGFVGLKFRLAIITRVSFEPTSTKVGTMEQ